MGMRSHVYPPKGLQGARDHIVISTLRHRTGSIAPADEERHTPTAIINIWNEFPCRFACFPAIKGIYVSDGNV